MYVELKTGFSDDGPAWIGMAEFSKTGRTVYFNGMVLKRSVRGEYHFEIESGDSYWVSGIKKNGTNRHWAGYGKIMIDKSVVQEYLQLTGNTELPKSRFKLVELNNEPQVQLANQNENQKL